MSMCKSTPELFATVVESVEPFPDSLDDSFPNEEREDPRDEVPFSKLVLEFKGGKKSIELLLELPGGPLDSKGNEENTRRDKRLSEEKRAEENPRSTVPELTLSAEFGGGPFSFIKRESIESTSVVEDPLDRVEVGESNNSMNPELDLSRKEDSFSNECLEGKEPKVSEYNGPKSEPEALLSFVNVLELKSYPFNPGAGPLDPDVNTESMIGASR
jgi:hypothetical protein